MAAFAAVVHLVSSNQQMVKVVKILTSVHLV